MAEGSPQDILDSIWASVDVKSLECCQCRSRIGPASILVRTFCLRSQYEGLASSPDYAQTIDVPSLGDQLVIFHRHMDCLAGTTEYVVISHVWHKGVADAQYRKGGSTACLSDVASVVREIPVRVCRGVAHGLGRCVEVWHDYISVPQWQLDVKGNIIKAIPKLFRRAMLTVVYASDLDLMAVEMMRSGPTAYIRCRAISDICNVKWFSRVWTAMEFIQSSRICFMAKDFHFLDATPDSSLQREDLVAEFGRRWSNEEGDQGNARKTEKMVDMNHNLVPWQLGPLNQVRWDVISERRCMFASAHELFARRGITNPRDFFHVLLDTLDVPQLTEDTLSKDTSKALMQIALSCLGKGDLSPLFMVPTFSEGQPDMKLIQFYGYNDAESFGLGSQERPPSDGVAKWSSANNTAVINAECIGKLRLLPSGDLFKDSKTTFARLVRVVLEIVGVDVDDFVRTLGGHMYGQDTEQVFQRLSKERRRSILKGEIHVLYSVWFAFDWAFGLSTTENPIIIARKCRGEFTDPYLIDLSDCLGNDDGHFSLGCNKFHLSARHVELTGTTLTAELRAINGQWMSDQIDVRSLINVCPATEQHLDCIADAMGLSKKVHYSEMTPLSPMEFFNSHGATIHRGPQGALLVAKCLSCHRDFLLRGALFSENGQGTSLMAWRIRGLKYTYTLEGGAGIVLNNGRIVGRFLWAPHTCDCPKRSDVEIVLNDIPKPFSNTFTYGGLKKPT